MWPWLSWRRLSTLIPRYRRPTTPSTQGHMGKDQGQPGGRREGEGRAWPRALLRFSWEGMRQAEQVHWIDLEWDGLNDFCRLWATYSFPGSTVIKNFPANAREGSLTLGLGRSPGVGNDNPLHYSCLENSIDRGASVQFSSVSQSCLTLCNHGQHARPPCPSPNPRVYSNSWVSDTIQPSHPWSSPSPPPSIFHSSRVFSNESALHIRWPKSWSFSFSISPSNEYSGLISFRKDWLALFAVQGTEEPGELQRVRC